MTSVTTIYTIIYTIYTNIYKYTQFYVYQQNKTRYDVTSISKEQCHDSDSILYTYIYTNVDTGGRVHGVPME